MSKTNAAVSSLVLLAVGLAPLGLAHNNPTEWVLQSSFAPHKKTDGADRVSGVYYGDLALLAGHNGPAIDPGSGTSFQFGVARAYCDLEVLSPGDSTGYPYDEIEVDDEPAAGILPTLFDDGGVGGACHTHTGFYLQATYNTAGCGYPDAYAADQASGGHAWITTVCDYGHPASVGLAGFLLSCVNDHGGGEGGLAQCVANPPGCLASSPVECALADNLPACAVDLSCLMQLGGCIQVASGAVPSACPLGTGLACGPNAEGFGGIQTPGNGGWGGDGVAFPSVPFPCADVDGAAAVFVWTAVFVDSLLQVVDLSVPTVGVIS